MIEVITSRHKLKEVKSNKNLNMDGYRNVSDFINQLNTIQEESKDNIEIYKKYVNQKEGEQYE